MVRVRAAYTRPSWALTRDSAPEYRLAMSDASKPRLSLVPLDGLPRVARNIEGGLRGDRRPGDWQHLEPGALRDALLRHIVAWSSGDPTEDHLAAITANALMLLWHEDRS